jgi:pimeloyl-ACP methyl ester carboxylesterase
LAAVKAVTTGPRAPLIAVSKRSLFKAAGAGVASVIGLSNAVKANLPVGAKSRGYAQGPFGLVHFHDTGGDGPPLIMCSQAPQTSRSFDFAMPELAKRGIRAIAVDTPGFGMSDAPDFVPTIEDYAKAIPPVLDHLGLAKVDILGHHTGCLIATEVALQFPDRVANLIMAGPLPLTPDERANYLVGNKKFEQDFVHETDGSHLMKGFQGRYKYYGPGADPKVITRLIVEKHMGYGPFWYGHHAAFVYDHNSAIPKVKHRTLILTNTGDAIYQNAQWTRRMRPDFAYAELQGGGIDITDQQPEAWAQAIAAFLHAGKK